MSAQMEPETGVDIWTAGGPWRFTREAVITGPPAESLYRIYRRSFEPLRTRAAARQVLTRGEFFSQMEDPRIDKYIAWEGEDEPIGHGHGDQVSGCGPLGQSGVLRRTDIPEQWARKAIYYLGFTLARPAIVAEPASWTRSSGSASSHSSRKRQ